MTDLISHFDFVMNAVLEIKMPAKYIVTSENATINLLENLMFTKQQIEETGDQSADGNGGSSGARRPNYLYTKPASALMSKQSSFSKAQARMSRLSRLTSPN